MHKEFSYRNFDFEIKIELNYKVERCINGERWHKITSSCKDKEIYYKSEFVNDKFLILHVEKEERLSKKALDAKLDGEPSSVDQLLNLGYQKKK